MDTVITNIGQLVTPIDHAAGERDDWYSVRVTTDTELHVHNGRVTDGGPHRSSSVKPRIVDAGGGIVMPGLVDPDWMLSPLPEWHTAIPASRLAERDLAAWNLRAMRRAAADGVTLIEAKSSPSGTLEGLDALGQLRQQHHPRVVGTVTAWLPEDRDGRDACVSSLIGEVIPEIRQRRLAAFCEIGWSGRPGALTEVRSVLRAASGAGLRLKLRLESMPSRNEVERLAASLDLAAVGCASCLPLDTVARLSSDGVIPVYVPALCHRWPAGAVNVRSLIEQDLPVAVGSGNGRSGTWSISMWSALGAAVGCMGLTLSEALVACTLNNALAMEMSHEVGTLEPGKRADLVALDLADFRELESAIAFPPISMVMVNGEIVSSV